jgi:hypothetical protein
MRRLRVHVAGRFAREALASGAGEVCLAFRRSFYLRFPGGRYACVGEPSLGHGPLNALVPALAVPAIGERLLVDTIDAQRWTPPALVACGGPDLEAVERAARGRRPAEGLACLIVGERNAIAIHAEPALQALERWFSGEALHSGAQTLIGLGPGLTPSGDDYFAGVLLALRACARTRMADDLWRWLEARIAARTSSISAAHLAAAAQGEAHEALHCALGCLFGSGADWDQALRALDAVGHCSGWDGLAGAVAVARVAASGRLLPQPPMNRSPSRASDRSESARPMSVMPNGRPSSRNPAGTAIAAMSRRFTKFV